MEGRDRFTLPTDLQNFRGDQFTEFTNTISLNNQQNFTGQSKTFPGDLNDYNMINGSSQMNRVLNESPRKNGDDTLTGLNKSQNVLHQLLTVQKEQQQQQQQQQQQHTTYPVSSPEYSKGSPVSSSGSPYTDSNLSPFTEVTQSSNCIEMDSHQSQFQEFSQSLKYPDTSTQSTLIKGTDRLRLDSFNTESCMDDLKPKLEWVDGDLENKTGKVARLQQDSDASSALSPSVDRVFNPEDAQQEVPKEFTFTVFGQQTLKNEDPKIEMLPFGDALQSEEPPVLTAQPEPSPFKTPTTMAQVKKHRESIRRQKEPILCQTFPSKLHGFELRILEQPEEQHRARYLTEGSRGAVKSKSGAGYPVVKLFGYKGEATLQVFIGNDSGKVRPHGFYQACKVCGKNSTACTEKDIDGTTVIEINLSPTDMSASIDCVGILKLRNADVEQRIGIAKAKKKSTKARMIFRVTFQKPCGSPQVLQIASSTILCTQPIGQPEICKMSLKECQSQGGEEIFIIGKNFLRGTRVFFQQVVDDQVQWEKEAEMDKDYFQTTHLIALVPQYEGDMQSALNTQFQVVIHSGGKISDPQPIAYRFEDTVIAKVDNNMDTVDNNNPSPTPTTNATPPPTTIAATTTEDTGRKRNYPFVAPEALELNQQIQQSQGSNSNSNDMFQLPPGIISGVITPTQETAPVVATTTALHSDEYTPMEESSVAAATASTNGTGTNHSTQNLTPQTFTIETEGEVLRKNSFTLNQNNFGPESLDTVHTQILDSKVESMYTDTEKQDNSLDLNVEPFAGSSSDFPDQNIMDTTFSQLKADEPFHTNSYDIIPSSSITTTNNIVSQFLQNMALKTSDPMLGGNQTLMSTRGLHRNNTIMTSANNHLVMAAEPRKATPSSITGGSLLKEVLTCPPASLDGFETYTLQNAHTNPAAYTKVDTPTLMEMDVHIDSLKTMLQSENDKQIANNSTLGFHRSSKDSMEYSSGTVCQERSEMIEISQETPQVLGTQQTGTPFSPEQIVPSQPSPYSPSEVLTNTYTVDQSTKPTVENVSSQFTEPQQQQQYLVTSAVNASLNSVLYHNANADTMTATTIATGFPTHSQPISQSGPTNPVIDVNTSTMSLLPQFLQQIASQGLSHDQQQVIHQHLQLQQQQQIQQQQQQPLQQQQAPVSQPQSPLQQLPQTIPASPLAGLNIDIQSPISSTPLQTPGFVLTQNLTGFTTTPTVFTAPQTQPSVMTSVSSAPMAPQIIICGNPGSAQGLPNPVPQGQYGAPSIVIVPGQGGANNQMESLLRSILGSMMQPQSQPPPQ